MNKWMTAIAALVAGGGLLAWVAGIAGTQADVQRRVDTVEKRQVEDRKDSRDSVTEVKEHVKIIDTNVQIILQKVSAMEAAQRAERRR